MADGEYAKRVAMAMRASRQYLGLSQRGMADLAGVSDSTISRYEDAAIQKLNAEQLVTIAHAIGVPAGVLVDPPATPDEVKELVADYRAKRREPGGSA